MQPLDLARRGRRARLGQPLLDPILPADPLEEHLHRLRLDVPTGELRSVIREHFRGHTVTTHRRGERRADRPPGRDRDHRRDDDEPGVVIDTGDQLARPAVRQRNTADDVHLPQVHRLGPLPPLERPLVLLSLGIDEPIADQNAVHRRPRRSRINAAPAEFMTDPPSTPARMPPP
nr:hypothetical protein [Amycolatopsis aidingensis]